MADKKQTFDAENVNAPDQPTSGDPISREEYDKLLADYQKVVRAFNRLMDEYNALHVKLLLADKPEADMQR